MCKTTGHLNIVWTTPFLQSLAPPLYIPPILFSLLSLSQSISPLPLFSLQSDPFTHTLSTSNRCLRWRHRRSHRLSSLLFQSHPILTNPTQPTFSFLYFYYLLKCFSCFVILPILTPRFFIFYFTQNRTHPASLFSLFPVFFPTFSRFSIKLIRHFPKNKNKYQNPCIDAFTPHSH